MYLTSSDNDAVILSYMLLSEIFAVVRSADNGIINEPVLQAINLSQNSPIHHD